MSVLLGLLCLLAFIGACVSPRKGTAHASDVSGATTSHEGDTHQDFAPDDDLEQQQESDEEFLDRQRLTHYEDHYLHAADRHACDEER